MLVAASLELKAEQQGAHSGWVTSCSVAFSPDGKTIVSGSSDKTIKVWDAGVLALTPSNPYYPLDLCGAGKKHVLLWPPHTDTLQLVEEREGDGSALDASGSGAVAERDGATLRLKEGGGVFYAPGPLQSVAVHWPRLVAGAASGELYHLEVEREELVAKSKKGLAKAAASEKKSSSCNIL